MEGIIEDILRACEERRKMGKEKYGNDSYVDKNMYQEIIEEHYDAINYNLFQIMKIRELEIKTKKLQKCVQKMMSGSSANNLQDEEIKEHNSRTCKDKEE